jgi:hypothetical protein
VNGLLWTTCELKFQLFHCNDPPVCSKLGKAKTKTKTHKTASPPTEDSEVTRIHRPRGPHTLMTTHHPQLRCTLTALLFVFLSFTGRVHTGCRSPGLWPRFVCLRWQGQLVVGRTFGLLQGQRQGRPVRRFGPNCQTCTVAQEPVTPVTHTSADSLPSHCLYTAYSLPIHCLFTAYSLPIHCLFTAYSLPIHCLFTAYLPPIHYVNTAYSLHIHCIFIAYS